MCAAPRSEGDGADTEAAGSTVRGLPACQCGVNKKRNSLKKPSISHVIVTFSFFLTFIANTTSPQQRAEIARRVFVKADSETHSFVPTWSEDKVYIVK